LTGGKITPVPGTQRYLFFVHLLIIQAYSREANKDYYQAQREA